MAKICFLISLKNYRLAEILYISKHGTGFNIGIL